MPGIPGQTHVLSHSGQFSAAFARMFLRPFLSLLVSSALSLVAGPFLQRLSVLAALRKGLAPAEHAGFGEQSRVWFQHLIQFVLPRLKYEMVASQMFKGGQGRGRESERLLKFKFY